MTDFVRWYDKDKILKAFMTLYEKMSPEAQIEIANDILINMSRIIKNGLDNFINN